MIFSLKCDARKLNSLVLNINTNLTEKVSAKIRKKKEENIKNLNWKLKILYKYQY